MPPLEQQLQDYLGDIAGERPALVDLPPGAAASLPLYLRERYRLMEARLFGRTWLLAVAAPDWELGSAQEYARHINRLQETTGHRHVVVVLPSMPSWSRKRLVRAGVPFIVPASQLFLPAFAIDLRERTPAPRKGSDRPLTPAAQAVLLLHLQKQPLADLPLREIARKAGYTAMMITKVKAELEAAGLCDTVRRGRSLVLKFPEERRILWDKAEAKLTSPVRKSRWVRWQAPGYPALAAGMTALSHRTLVEDDPHPTFALWDATFRARLERGVFHSCPDAAEADIQLQAWSYNPVLLGDGKDVDPLSLYLSLRGSADERVQQQLDTLLAQFPW